MEQMKYIIVWICGHGRENWMDLTLPLVDPIEEVFAFLSFLNYKQWCKLTHTAISAFKAC